MTATTAEHAGVPEVLCVGEAMVAFAPVVGSLRTSDETRMFVAGAESNVAGALAHLGRRVEWFGRVGDDPFGARVLDSLRARGVDTARVVIDETRPTGIYFKDRMGAASTMYYYRAGSAASGMEPSDASLLALGERRLIHLTGITPALSPGCDALVERILAQSGDAHVSFDVNFRAKLWPADVAGPRIRDLARLANIVITGRDEAHTLWGTETPQDVRELFPDVATIVVKDSDIGATEFRGGREVFVPALHAEVVEPIGAGDAFAAGYLAGRLEGRDAEFSLRLGHVLAAHALSDISDSPALPSVAALHELAGRSDEAWCRSGASLTDNAYAATSSESGRR
ncbi:MAG: hypothetical protein BGO26_04435 [Actinobacteria bacterium 69-20]|nr:sugar kinase [Actinomycetota bacterium]OJV26856.1 MAG: hypothetical protein BGO26_04435 [Actinobacteria bacterium 69-20]